MGIIIMVEEVNLIILDNLKVLLRVKNLNLSHYKYVCIFKYLVIIMLKSRDEKRRKEKRKEEKRREEKRREEKRREEKRREGKKLNGIKQRKGQERKEWGRR